MITTVKHDLRKDDCNMKKVIFPTGNVMYVNEKDYQSTILIPTQGVSQPLIYHFWQQALQKFDPTLILDAGMNYGGILFSGIYPSHAVIVGIEPNQSLVPYIDQSRAEHPNREQIKIFHAVASDQDNQLIKFYICSGEHVGSGGSSAIPRDDSPSYNMISSITIDTLLNNITTNPARFLFKIDVEGYEDKLLKGMTKQIALSEEAIGCIEFTPIFMQRAGTDGDAYLNFLQQYFKVYHPLDPTRVVHIKNLNMKTIYHYLGSNFIQTDFLLTTKEATLRKLNYQIIDQV